MNLDQATKIAEIVASIATIVTLAYLAVQIRLNNKHNKAESRRSTLNHSAQLATAIGQSREASEVFYLGITNYRDLSEAKKLQFEFLFSVLAGHCTLAFEDWQLGLNDKSSFETTSREFFRMLATPGGLEYWKRHGKTSDVDFYHYVNKHVFDGKPPVYAPMDTNPESAIP